MNNLSIRYQQYLETGNADALLTEVQTYCRSLASRKVKDCEDLVQDTVIEVWRSLPKYDATRAAFPTFVYMIFRAQLAKALRKHYTHAEVDGPLPDLNEVVAESRPDAMRLNLDGESALLVDAISQGYSVCESARRIGISRKRARGLLSRIRLGKTESFGISRARANNSLPQTISRQ